VGEIEGGMLGKRNRGRGVEGMVGGKQGGREGRREGGRGKKK